MADAASMMYPNCTIKITDCVLFGVMVVPSGYSLGGEACAENGVSMQKTEPQTLADCMHDIPV